MVGANLMEQICNEESFYEEVIINEDRSPTKHCSHSTDVERSDITETPTGQSRKPNSTQVEVEEFENIYEVIPGDSSLHSCGKCAVNRSASFCCADNDRKNTREEKAAQKEKDTCSNSAPMSSSLDREENYSQYAQIIHSSTTTDFMPSRPTRDSENPILRQDFSGNLDFLPNLRNLRKHLTDVSQDRRFEREKRSPKSTPSCTPESERKPEQTQESGGSRGVSPKESPNQSPRAKTSPEPIYMNMNFPLVDGDDDSRRSSESSCSYTERQSVSSNDDSVFRDADTPSYENVKSMSFPASTRQVKVSVPVDIVYSDLEFHESHRTAKSEGEENSFSNNTESMNDVIEEKSRSLPPQSCPRLGSRATDLNEFRSKSKSLGKLSGGSLGFYVAGFVKKATVQRSNSKTLQSAIHDIVSKTKVEECSAVNVELTSDTMRISTNFPPWEVVASFGIETIGCIDLYEHDRTTLGVIVCEPGEEAVCYVISCLDADQIYKVITNAFNSTNSKTFKVSVSSPVGPESWLGDDDITTFADIVYIGSLKVKKSYLLINQSITTLLEKAHPRDFKSIYLEVKPDNIRIIDANDNAVLAQHAIPWILLLGVYEEDKRLFGYIVSEARQGEKTRMYCHAFRCSRVTSSVAASEVIRLGCQASYGDRRESIPRSRRRNSSMVSHSSRGSVESNDGSLPTAAQVPTSLVEESEGEHYHVNQDKPKAKEKKMGRENSKMRRFSSMPHLIRGSGKREKEHKLELDTSQTSRERAMSAHYTSSDDIIDRTWEIVEEKDYTFNATYLCSTVINPPLRAKHIRDCVKQYQKQQLKSLKRFGVEQPSSDVVLRISLDGVSMKNARTQSGGNAMFFPFSSVNHVMAHPENPEYFAFATVVSGDSKHKCHLFKQTHVPTTDVIDGFLAFM